MSQPHYLTYQHRFCEVLLPNSEILDECTPLDTSPQSIDDEVQELRDQLLARLLKLAKRLPIKKLNIIRLRLTGLTQTEIAKQLGVQQPAVHKLEKSALDQLRAIAAKDEDVLDLLAEIDCRL